MLFYSSCSSQHFEQRFLNYNYFAHSAWGNPPLLRPLFVQNERKTEKSNDKVQHWKIMISLFLPLSLRFLSFSDISCSCATSNFLLSIQTTVNLGPFAVNTGLRTCIHTETVYICHTLNWPTLLKPDRFSIALVQQQFSIHFSQLKLLHLCQKSHWEWSLAHWFKRCMLSILQ